MDQRRVGVGRSEPVSRPKPASFEVQARGGPFPSWPIWSTSRVSRRCVRVGPRKAVPTRSAGVSALSPSLLWERRHLRQGKGRGSPMRTEVDRGGPRWTGSETLHLEAAPPRKENFDLMSARTRRHRLWAGPPCTFLWKWKAVAEIHPALRRGWRGGPVLGKGRVIVMPKREKQKIIGTERARTMSFVSLLFFCFATFSLFGPPLHLYCKVEYISVIPFFSK